MKAVRTVNLPQDALHEAVVVATKARDQLGVAVPVSRATLMKIEEVLQGALSECLQQVRDRERAPSSDSLKLRIG